MWSGNKVGGVRMKLTYKKDTGELVEFNAHFICRDKHYNDHIIAIGKDDTITIKLWQLVSIKNPNKRS